VGTTEAISAIIKHEFTAKEKAKSTKIVA